MEAKGTFNVDMTPADSTLMFEHGAQFGQLTINKRFTGDLTGSSVGQMMSCRFSESPSAGYVALEQVTATLNGKHGSFVLQHFGVMSADGQRLVLEVLPNSGTNDLAGLSGTMTIDIVEGTHHYHLSYALN